MKPLAYLLPLAIVVGPSASWAQDADPVGAILAKYEAAGGPGCSVAASKNGETVVSRRFGLANLEHGVAIGPSTRFDIASTSKQFTAAAVLLLVQDGKLSLSDDIRTHLKEMPDHGSTITVDHLLVQTSGLRDYPFLTELQGWWPEARRQHTNDELVALIAAQRELNFEPGARWSYSNSNYVLAAEIVERVSGVSLREFLTKRIFEPLGMTSTVLRDDHSTLIPGQAGAYFGPPGELKRAVPASRYGDSNLVSTPEDLLIWNHALANERLGALVSRELQRAGTASSGRTLSYARGLFVTQYKGHSEISHSGGSLGATAFSARYPEHGFAVAMACNAMVPVEEVAHQIADLFLPKREEPTPAVAPQKAALLQEQRQRLAGVYLDQDRGVRLTLSEREGVLMLANETATPVSSTVLRLSGSGQRELVVEGAGALTLRDLTTGIQRRLLRLDTVAPSDDELASLKGRYRSSEIGTTYDVTPKAGGVVLQIADPQLEWPVEAITRDVFDAGRDTIRFLRDANGRATAFEISNARNRKVRFDRLED